ncbi:MAG: Rieske 2Fe-2S domain-containing protein [Chloroflexota bacterium]|nr:Rieske 2Fe-2S domain-containing protein [Chloroflexota bacterium]
MLTREDNDLVTQVGPGTPMGELFRRFWLPVMLSEEVPNADSTPVRVTVLGEKLIGFKDTNGNVGLVDAYCPHRGAPLFFGRNEECGIRCVYHGWKFDVDGNCVELPNSPEGETYKDKVQIKSYPAVERAGLVWAYMGPKDKQPPMPGFDWLNVPQENRYLMKFILQCNYLQGMEGDYDPSHAMYLHSTLDNNASNRALQVSQVGNTFQDPRQIYVDIEDTDGGIEFVSSGLAERGKLMSLGHWMMPIFCTAGIAGPGIFSSNMRVPIDDESCMFYRLRWSYDPIPDYELAEYKYGQFTHPELIPGTFYTKANMQNDYMVDRIAQKNYSYTGIKNFPLQDIALIEDQWGPIAEREKEHLVRSDEGIIRVRQRLIRTARKLMEGEEPSEPMNPQGFNARTVRKFYPHDFPVQDAVKELKEHRHTARRPVLENVTA